MADWITLQDAADKVGVKKGTLAMWRNRNKFPFKTQGTGKNLMVSSESVETWVSKNQDKIKPRKSSGRKPGPKKGAKRGRKPGTTTLASKVGIPEIEVAGTLNLETVQNFVTDIQGGATVQIVPTRDGFKLSTLKD